VASNGLRLDPGLLADQNYIIRYMKFGNLRSAGAPSAVVQAEDPSASSPPPPPEEQERRQVGPEAGPTPAFYRCIPTGMHGPTWIFWTNLTSFSLRALTRFVRTTADYAPVDPVDGSWPDQHPCNWHDDAANAETDGDGAAIKAGVGIHVFIDTLCP
jgi:hypothetical protein